MNDRTGRSLYCSSFIGTSDGMSIGQHLHYDDLCVNVSITQNHLTHILFQTVFIYKQWCFTHQEREKKSKKTAIVTQKCPFCKYKMVVGKSFS